MEELIDGTRVRKLREGLEMSQQDLANKIKDLGFGKVTYQAIQQLEEGTTKKPRYARYLPDAVRTTWEYLTGKTENPARPVGAAVNSLFTEDQSKFPNHPLGMGGREGPHMLIEISKMLGVMEGSLKTSFSARFDQIQETLSDHGKRLDALEGRPNPHRGRKR